MVNEASISLWAPVRDRAANKFSISNPKGPDSAFDPAEPNEKKRVHRGGSFLCNDQFCSRYMVGTRGKGEINTATDHLGFRCVKSSSQQIAEK